MPADHAELAGILGDLVQTTHRLARLAARATGSTESPATWRTLAELQTSGPLRLGELAAQSRVSQPTMTNLVAGLEERGWVRRLPDVTDARASVVEATVDGIAALDAWRHRITAELLPLFEDLTIAETATLKDAVAIVGRRTDVAQAGPASASSVGDTLSTRAESEVRA